MLTLKVEKKKKINLMINSMGEVDTRVDWSRVAHYVTRVTTRMNKIIFLLK